MRRALRAVVPVLARARTRRPSVADLAISASRRNPAPAVPVALSRYTRRDRKPPSEQHHEAKPFSLALASLALLGLGAQQAAADIVLLKGGDRLSGTIVGKDDEELTLETAYAGKEPITCCGAKSRTSRPTSPRASC